MSKVTYTDKIDITVSQLADVYKIKAADVNELKTSINALYDEQGGWGDYNNSSSTQQNLVADTWLELTNDGAGLLTDETELPPNVTTLFTPNAADFSEIAQGRQLSMRVDLSFQSLSNNTHLDIRASFKNSSGVEVYNVGIYDGDYKRTSKGYVR